MRMTAPEWTAVVQSSLTITFVRYVIHLLVQPGWWFVFSLLEKSSWLLSARVALSPGVSGSSAVLLVSDPILLAKITGQLWPGRSAVKVHI